MRVECPRCLSEQVQQWADHTRIEHVYPHLHYICLDCGRKFMICPCCGGELKTQLWESLFGLILYVLLSPVRWILKKRAPEIRSETTNLPVTICP